MIRRAWVLAWVGLGWACAPAPVQAPAPYVWPLPPGFPEPAVPEANPMSEAKVELGRHLFYDVRLSANGTQSCASCHAPERAFSDGLALPTGSTGQIGIRNAQMLANVAYLGTLTWANPILDTLEGQALVPLTGEDPLELGLTAEHVPQALRALEAEPRYPPLFEDAFPGDASPFTLARVSQALASFQRSLLSGGAPYDAYAYLGQAEALSPEAKLGLALFFSEKLECYHCHAGPTFSTSFRSAQTRLAELDFQNNGLYNVDGKGAYPARNVGLAEFSGRPQDMGRFRVPTLRNLSFSAPYMHDGSIATLEEVVDHYAAGGRTVTEGPYAGVGKLSPYKSPFVRGFTLSEAERTGLLAFLRSLDDPAFLVDPRFQNPWR